MHTLQDRIENNIQVSVDSGCWIWQGGKDRDGYGTMWIGPKPTRKRRYVHRMSYEAFIDEIPDGLEIDHLCRVKICCNPDHLEVVTTQENTRRRDVAHQTDRYCRNGHRRTKENTYITPDGYRACGVCRTAAQRRYWSKQKQLRDR